MGILIERPAGRGRAHPVPLGQPDIVVALTVAVAVAAGTMLALAPLPAFGAVAGSMVVVLMAALGRRSAQVFVIALGLLLTAYAFLGRGVAYVGAGSFYIGEAVLFLGVLAFLLNLGRVRFGPFHWLLVAFMAVGLIRTLPFLGPYGIVALRDGVVWGYAFFALAVATTFDPRWFEPLTRAYGWVVPVFLLWIPLATALFVGFAESLPRWPDAPVPILFLKQGDWAVHLAGIAAFFLVGLDADRRGRIPSTVIWALFFVDLALVGAVSRGGLVSALVGIAGALLFVRSTGRLMTAAGIALAGFILLYALNPSVTVDNNQGRTLSFSQLVDNVASVVVETDRGNLQGTKEWRLAWWDKIVDYTVDGPYFWTGKGFGINLADDDGFQVLADRSLRAPHNGHLAILARGGVPLLGLWMALQAAFAIGLLRAARRARAVGRQLLVMLAAWVFAIWSAALVNMTFDVYLEGPQGGIWFWSVIGLGLVVMDEARRAGGGTGSLPASSMPHGLSAGGTGQLIVAPNVTTDTTGATVGDLPAGVSGALPRAALPALSPTTGAVMGPTVKDRPPWRDRRARSGPGPDYLPAPPPSVTSVADDFFDGLIRRVEGGP